MYVHACMLACMLVCMSVNIHDIQVSACRQSIMCACLCASVNAGKHQQCLRLCMRIMSDVNSCVHEGIHACRFALPGSSAANYAFSAKHRKGHTCAYARLLPVHAGPTQAVRMQASMLAQICVGM
jgi:hypothetical protein